MSRIGKKPIAIPSGVKVEVKGRECKVEGPKGKLSLKLPPLTALKVEGTEIQVDRDGGIMGRGGESIPGPRYLTGLKRLSDWIETPAALRPAAHWTFALRVC